jgi:hypothetical protein
LTLLSYDSLSPHLLRTDPAALASWIRYRFIRWLTGVALSKTEWTYKTEHAVTVPVGPKGSDTQKLTLTNGTAGTTMQLQYKFPGLALPIGAPLLQTDNRGYAPERTGRTIWTPGKTEGEGGNSNIKTLAGMKRAVLIDLHSLFGRRTEGGEACGAMMLFGLDFRCMTWMQKMGYYTSRLLDMSVEGPRTRGTLSMEDVRQDVDTSFQEAGFEGALFFDGVDGGTSSLVAYLGELPNATAEDHTGQGDSAAGGK